MRSFFLPLTLVVAACAKSTPAPPAEPPLASATTTATPECQAARCQVKGECDALLQAVIWNGHACVTFEESGCSIACTSQHRSMSECESVHAACSK